MTTCLSRPVAHHRTDEQHHRDDTHDAGDAGDTHDAEHSARSCGQRDTTLLSAARQGDPDAIGELFRSHWPKALSIARSRCRQPADAADICALAFERIIIALRNGRGPSTTFDGYLRVTITHLAANHHHRERILVLMPEIPEPTYPPPSNDPDHTPLTSAIAELTSEQRTLLWLVDVMGYTPADIASRSHQIPNTVAAQLYRARRRLKNLYQQALPATA